jgi:hypothetical protein
MHKKSQDLNPKNGPLSITDSRQNQINNCNKKISKLIAQKNHYMEMITGKHKYRFHKNNRIVFQEQTDAITKMIKIEKSKLLLLGVLTEN